MTQAEIKQFRRRIGDQAKAETDTVVVDGGQLSFELRFHNIYSVSVFKDGELVSSGSYTVISSSGLVTFGSGIVADGDSIQFDYSYSAYTDAEIETLVEDYGFDQAVVEVITELLADSARMYDYTNGATDAKLSQIFKQLKELLEVYTDKANKAEEGYTTPDGSNIGHVKMGERRNDWYSRTPVIKPDLSRDDLQ